MNSQEYHSLQEAYMNVYQEVDEETRELDEVRGGGEIDPVSDIPGIGLRGARSPKDAGLQMSPLDRAKLRANALEKRGNPKAKKRASDINKNFIRPTEKAVNRSLLAATNARHAEKTRLMNPQESYDPDLFDVILEHLITEGYADTNENALVIMANMSEEWRESIVEEVLDERNRGEGGMSDREVSRRRNLGGNTRSKVSSSSLGDHGPQGAIQKFHNVKSKQREAIHKTSRGVRGDTGESGGKGRYEANKDHKDGYPSITKRGQGPS